MLHYAFLSDTDRHCMELLLFIYGMAFARTNQARFHCAIIKLTSGLMILRQMDNATIFEKIN